MMIKAEIEEKIKSILPENWEEKAQELGAYGRSRQIKSVFELIILLLLYATSGKSLGGTSSILKSSGTISLNKNAVRERLEKSVEYIKWLNENINQQSGFIVNRPSWLEYRRVLAVDATVESVSGGESREYDLHYMTDIFTLDCIETHVTDEKTGEKLSNYEQLGAGDIVLGDRMYGTLKSIKYALSKGADYVLRLKSNAFNLYDVNGKLVDLSKKIRRMREAAHKKFELYYKDGGSLKPINICVYRKDAAQIMEADKAGSERVKFYDKYVVVATSLSIPPAQILELYRLRWQIELLFKRLKSIFQLDGLKAKKTESVKLWFYCKLLLASICESLDNQGRFSPSELFSFDTGEQME